MTNVWLRNLEGWSQILQYLIAIEERWCHTSFWCSMQHLILTCWFYRQTASDRNRDGAAGRVPAAGSSPGPRLFVSWGAQAGLERGQVNLIMRSIPDVLFSALERHGPTFHSRCPHVERAQWVPSWPVLVEPACWVPECRSQQLPNAAWCDFDDIRVFLNRRLCIEHQRASLGRERTI